MEPDPRPPRRPDRSARGHRLLRRAALLGAAWVALGAAAPADAGTATNGDFAIVVDRGAALFELSGLIPGPIGSRCLRVQVENGAADVAVLSAEVGGTGLADFLELSIDAGTSSDTATCAAFSGSNVFQGTLAELGLDHPVATSGIPIPLIDQTSIVLRFTLSLRDDNAAQGRSATARFVFDAQDVSPPPTTTVPETPTTPAPTAPPVATTAPEPPTTVVPTTVPQTTTSAPSTTVAAGGSSTSRVPRTTVAAVPPETTASGGTDLPRVPQDATTVVIDGDDEPGSIAEQAAETVKEVAQVAAKAAGVTARTSAVPGVFSTFVLGFLVLQARTDRRDPKLATAPIEPEPELEFLPRRRSGGAA